MARSQKPRKHYNPKYRSGHVKLRAQPWKIHAVFEPIESILDEMEQQGTVSVDQDDAPIFSELAHNDVYEFVPALGGLIDAFDLHAERHGLPVVTDALKHLCVKLEKSEMLDQHDMAAARRSIAAMKTQAGEMEVDYAFRLVRDVQIKFKIEECQAIDHLAEAA
ncbi:hypothetical protein [Burkholderia lata]|uniref:Uncharacterized protein n=1 Tax=Burkholderia lata (strain ATCC 17760 / DSM 23089 / LMG 22485 / NCIMB 9086 / R18194 / 383) TaxID=482957 RepID=A0A6P2GTJ8_BURL3|nr:hypothetical protein [Burkholderia lata]VWB07742.1 hypothetical protein BLA6863_00183 [Burkholderia lata]